MLIIPWKYTYTSSDWLLFLLMLSHTLIYFCLRREWCIFDHFVLRWSPAWSWTNHTKMGGGERSFAQLDTRAIKLKGPHFYFKSFLFLFLFFGSLSIATQFLLFDPSPFTLFWHIPYTVYHNVIHIHSNEIARDQYHILHGVVRVYCVHCRL